MSQKSSPASVPSERLVKDLRRATRRQYSAEEKIRIVLDGLRGEASIAELCRREGLAESMYYAWSKEFLEAGKRRLAGDTARAATTDEVKNLRQEARTLKEVVAEQALEIRLLKKHDRGWGRPRMRYPASEKLEIMKNRILLENHYLPGDLEAQVGAFVEHYNHHRYHESLNNLTPAGVYSGRGHAILARRQRIKNQTIQQRRLLHQQIAA